MKACNIFLLLLITLIFSCTKDEALNSGVNSNSSFSNSCTQNGTINDSVIHNATTFKIVGSSGSNNSILLEVGGASSNVVITTYYLQASKNGDCFESTNSTMFIAPQYKAHLFTGFPSWANDTNTVLIAKIKIDSTVYFLRDLKLNKY